MNDFKIHFPSLTDTLCPIITEINHILSKRTTVSSFPTQSPQSFVLMEMLYSAIAQKSPTLFLTFKNRPEEISHQILLHYADLSEKNLLESSQVGLMAQNIVQAMNMLENCPLWFDCCLPFRLPGLHLTLHYLKQKQKLEKVIIDDWNSVCTQIDCSPTQLRKELFIIAKPLNIKIIFHTVMKDKIRALQKL